MLEEQVSNEEGRKPKISIGLKFCLVLCTLVYLLLFPFLLWGAFFYLAATFDLSGVPRLVNLTQILLMFCYPFSLLVSIYLIITGYGKEARALRFACALPLIVFAAVSIIDGILRIIFWR